MAYRRATKDTYEWIPVNRLIDDVKYAVLLLNHSLDHLNGHKSLTFDNIWRKAERRVAVDGGSKYLQPDHTLPDILCGDFDSVTTDRLNHFRQKGVKIMATPDQNYTDFQKAVKIILHLNKRSVYENNNVSAVVANNGHNGSPSPQPPTNGQQSPPPPSPRDREGCGAIIAIWSSLGRIDQVLTNINTLYINELENGYGAGEGGQHYVPIILFQVHNSVTFLLHKGTHVIESHHEAKWCSLVPVGAPCLVTTTGFRWNLTKDTMSFGSLISTSNEFDPECRSVRIETDRPVLFSYDISKSDPLVIPNK